MTLTAGVPEKLKPLFWDVDWEKMDVVHHEGFIIERVLNMGDAFALRWAESVFSLEAIWQAVRRWPCYPGHVMSGQTASCSILLPCFSISRISGPQDWYPGLSARAVSFSP